MQYSDALRSFRGCLCVSGHPVVIGRLSSGAVRQTARRPAFFRMGTGRLVAGFVGWRGYFMRRFNINSGPVY